MKDSLIVTEVDGQTVLGNLNVAAPYYVEVKLISPYAGFINSAQPSQEPQWDGETKKSVAENLLHDAYLICADLQRNHETAKADFEKLLSNLQNFHNKKPEEYFRNRNELMKVLLKANVPNREKIREQNADINAAVFCFLGNYFLMNVTSAKPDFRSSEIEDTAIPPFAELQERLVSYNQMNGEEKLSLLAQQIITGIKTENSWFLMQEFQPATLK